MHNAVAAAFLAVAWAVTAAGHADIGICVLGTMIAVNGQPWKKMKK